LPSRGECALSVANFFESGVLFRPRSAS